MTVQCGCWARGVMGCEAAEGRKRGVYEEREDMANTAQSGDL